MGDRCSLTGWVHPEDQERLFRIIGGEPYENLCDSVADLLECWACPDDPGVFEIEEVNYGAFDALEAAADEGLRFWAFNGHGQGYTAGLYVSTGTPIAQGLEMSGKVELGLGVHVDTDMDEILVCRVLDNGTLDDCDVARIQGVVPAMKALRTMAQAVFTAARAV